MKRTELWKFQDNDRFSAVRSNILIVRTTLLPYLQQTLCEY